MPKLRVMKIGGSFVSVRALLRPLCEPDLYPTEVEKAAEARQRLRFIPYPLLMCCPALEDLHLCWDYNKDPTGDVAEFSDLLRSRKTGGRQIPRLIVYSAKGYDGLKPLFEQADIASLVGEFAMEKKYSKTKVEKELMAIVEAHL